VAAPGSEKNPVYWEDQRPTYDRNAFTGSEKLPNGMIRLVGRYWEERKTYKTTLTAHGSDGKSAAIDIEVKKPESLGSLYPKAKDVFNMLVDIDDTCITYGGKHGVPPQLIKAQMEEEAKTHDFGGLIGRGFAPAYRYEPYTYQFKSWVRNRTRNPFFVTADKVNDPPLPDHKNVEVIPYLYPNKTVWDIIYDHSQLVNDAADSSHRLYGIRTYADTMNFSPYNFIQVRYDVFLNAYKTLLPLSQAASLANKAMATFLRDEWNGGVKNGPKGLKNILAQTRIASSYGLLQVMYPTAINRGYDENVSHLPENLNITPMFMRVCMPYQKTRLINNIGASADSGGNWPEGFEKSFYDFVYSKWNTRKSYPVEVFQKSRQYLPQPKLQGG
jgi:hypothetical protein